MRVIVLFVAMAIAAVSVAAGPAHAETKKVPPRKKDPPGVMRSASGTIIQPTRTIIHNPDGSTTVIVVPRRSYLDVGTEVSPGDTSYTDYAFPPGGDPGRPNWFYGPDHRGEGSFPLPPAFYIPGWNPNTP